MSSDNPRVGKSQADLMDWPDPNYNSYNPAEVRLYGRPVDCFPIVYKEEEFERRLKEELGRNNLTPESLPQIARIARSVALESIVKVIGNQFQLSVASGEHMVCTLPVNINFGNCQAAECIKSAAVVYGYAYEGHCYKLPKPQIMLLPEPPHPIVHGDCSCECGYEPELGYAVWSTDKLDLVVVLDVRSDDVKTLVLDANTPGNRSPLAYAQTMALAPQRGGA
jgi:hypothetical protein